MKNFDWKLFAIIGVVILSLLILLLGYMVSVSNTVARKEYKKYIKIFPHKQILSAQGYEPMNVDYLTFDAEELEVIDNMFGD